MYRSVFNVTDLNHIESLSSANEGIGEVYSDGVMYLPPKVIYAPIPNTSIPFCWIVPRDPNSLIIGCDDGATSILTSPTISIQSYDLTFDPDRPDGINFAYSGYDTSDTLLVSSGRYYNAPVLGWTRTLKDSTLNTRPILDRTSIALSTGGVYGILAGHRSNPPSTSDPAFHAIPLYLNTSNSLPSISRYANDSFRPTFSGAVISDTGIGGFAFSGTPTSLLFVDFYGRNATSTYLDYDGSLDAVTSSKNGAIAYALTGNRSAVYIASPTNVSTPITFGSGRTRQVTLTYSPLEELYQFTSHSLLPWRSPFFIRDS